MRQHIRLSHPEEYNAECEGEVSRKKRRLNRDEFDEDAVIAMPRVEAAFTGKLINIESASSFEDWSADDIRKFRKNNKDYHDLVNSIRGLPYSEEPVKDQDSSDEEDDHPPAEVLETTIIPGSGPIWEELSIPQPSTSAFAPAVASASTSASVSSPPFHQSSVQ